MTLMSDSLHVSRLGKRRLSALTKKAESLGVTPEMYVRLLIERDLELDRRAREETFARIMGPGRAVNEGELDRVVRTARTRHQRELRGGRRTKG